MKTLALSFCAVALLTACGERGASSQTGEKPASGAAQMRAEMDAEHAVASADIAEAERKRGAAAAEEGAERRVLAYKQALLPLIARHYVGTCSAKSGPVEGAAIKVGSDGVVLASGFQQRDAKDDNIRLTVNLKREDGAALSPGFSVLSGSDEWGVVKPAGKESVIYSEGRDALQCVNDAFAGQGKVSALFPSLAGFFAAGGGTVTCSKSMGPAKPYKIVVTASALMIGGDAFPLGAVDGDEAVLVDAREQTLMYSRDADGAQVTMQLGRSGKLSAVGATADRGKTAYTCSPNM